MLCILLQRQVARAKTKLLTSQNSAWTDVDELKATQQLLAGIYN